MFPLAALIIGVVTGISVTVTEPKVEKFGKEYLTGEKPAALSEINNGVQR